MTDLTDLRRDLEALTDDEPESITVPYTDDDPNDEPMDWPDGRDVADSTAPFLIAGGNPAYVFDEAAWEARAAQVRANHREGLSLLVRSQGMNRNAGSAEPDPRMCYQASHSINYSPINNVVCGWCCEVFRIQNDTGEEVRFCSSKCRQRGRSKLNRVGTTCACAICSEPFVAKYAASKHCDACRVFMKKPQVRVMS